MRKNCFDPRDPRPAPAGRDSLLIRADTISPSSGLHAVHSRHIQVLFTPFGTGRGLDELYMW